MHFEQRPTRTGWARHHNVSNPFQNAAFMAGSTLLPSARSTFPGNPPLGLAGAPCEETWCLKKEED